MILVDASVWIAFFNRQNGVSPSVETLCRLIENDADIVVGDLIYLEVLRGFRDDRHYTAAKTALDAFDRINLLDHDIAIHAAHVYRELRRTGITIRNTPDLIIATYCIKTKTKLLHNDKDFHPFVRHFQLREVK